MTAKYAHTNLIAKDWKRLADFYQDVFACTPVPPERDLSGAWLDRATGIHGARICGIHLLLPGHGEHGPTLEIFQYETSPEHPSVNPDTLGFSHLAFAVEDVEATAETVFARGGSALGECTTLTVPGVGRLTFQYVRDPEENILEIQHWEKGS
ncbi:MAG: VOC family protein [Desulfobacteraceae bacterium]|jgi:predicted enzyme related to lactoylglutathione lyase